MIGSSFVIDAHMSTLQVRKTTRKNINAKNGPLKFYFGLLLAFESFLRVRLESIRQPCLGIPNIKENKLNIGVHLTYHSRIGTYYSLSLIHRIFVISFTPAHLVQGMPRLKTWFTHIFRCARTTQVAGYLSWPPSTSLAATSMALGCKSFLRTQTPLNLHRTRLTSVQKLYELPSR